MPYCPKCRDEFRAGAEICPDCNVALVEELPPLPEEKSRERLVYIATVSGEPEAEIVSGILEENDIRCLIRGRNFGAAVCVSPLHDPYEIFVLASHEEEAREVLAPFMEDEPEDDELAPLSPEEEREMEKYFK